MRTRRIYDDPPSVRRRNLFNWNSTGQMTLNPLTLFLNGEQGVWYDPSDFSTMFQDSAGTTPVTAVGQPIGKILDKSGRGNHATQATSTKRPVLSAKVNLLTKTEKFSVAPWGVANLSIVDNTAIAPNGTLTACTITRTAGSVPILFQGTGVTTAFAYTASCYAKSNTYNILGLEFRGGTAGPTATFNLDLGTVASGVGTITSVGNGWYKCSVVGTATDASESIIISMGTVASTQSIFVWGASVVPTSQASIPYQWVDTATSYDTAGFPHYLKFDGVDDALETSAINFTATDKMTVFAGVRKLSDAATGMVVELSATNASNNGSFALTAPNSVAGNYAFESKGTVLTNAVAATYTSPITSVVTGIGIIAADSNIIRVNGAQIDSDAGDQGTGNFGTYPLYIGSRGGTTLPFNGHIYSLIVRGAQSTTTQIVSAETYVNGKTGAY